MTDARKIIEPDGKALIAEAITEYFGERCPDSEETCACCKAWAAWDRILGPDEVDQVTLEEAAALIEARKEGADQFYRHDCDEHAAAIRSIGRKA